MKTTVGFEPTSCSASAACHDTDADQLPLAGLRSTTPARRLLMACYVALLAAVFLFPAKATAHEGYEWEVWTERCADMTREVNAFRDTPDLRVFGLACRVATRRVIDMALTGKFGHDMGPIVNALNAAGVHWCQVGEVVASRSVWTSSHYWTHMWWESEPHREALDWSGYQLGGGMYTARTVDGEYNVRGVYYVVRLCP